MRLRKGMINKYLGYITSIVFVDPEDVVEDMSVYDEAIHSLSVMARNDGNLEALRLAMNSLIANPEGRLSMFYGSGYPFSDHELHSILVYAYQSIWPDAHISKPGRAAPVDFIDVSETEWDAENGG